MPAPFGLGRPLTPGRFHASFLAGVETAYQHLIFVHRRIQLNILIEKLGRATLVREPVHLKEHRGR